MTEFAIADNADIEVACVIDTDNFRPLPFVAVGPNRQVVLTTFLDSMPFDVTVLPSDTQRDVFNSFLSERTDLLAPPPVEADQPQVDVGAGENGNVGDALATMEAHHATDVPAEQPADTDVETHPSPQTVEVKCWNCGGTGRVEFGGDQPAQTCNMCNGTGKVTQEVAA